MPRAERQWATGLNPRASKVQAPAFADEDRAEAATPLSKPDSKALFDRLDETADEGCDGTLRRTENFLHERGVPEAEITDWLMHYGGGCDCEVLANVEEVWGQRVGSLD